MQRVPNVRQTDLTGYEADKQEVVIDSWERNRPNAFPREENLSDGDAIPPARIIRFGSFELDVRAAELRKHGTRIRLHEQPYRILLMLLNRPGEVVFRDEIRKALWPSDTIVEFDHSINAAIQRLRSALGDAADNPSYVETLARRGYRFIGTVEPNGRAAPVDEAALRPAGRIRGADPSDLSAETFSHFREIEKLPTSTGLINLSLPSRWSNQVAVSAVLILLLLAGGTGWLLQRNSRARWAKQQGLPELASLIEQEKYTAAFSLAERVEKSIPSDPVLIKLWPRMISTVTIHTTPPGAEVYRKDYDAPDARWERVGVTPIENV